MIALQKTTKKSPKDHVFRKRTRQNARRESLVKSKKNYKIKRLGPETEQKKL